MKIINSHTGYAIESHSLSQLKKKSTFLELLSQVCGLEKCTKGFFFRKGYLNDSTGLVWVAIRESHGMQCWTLIHISGVQIIELTEPSVVIPVIGLHQREECLLQEAGEGGNGG